MASKTEKMDVTIVSSLTLSDIWGISDRRVRQLAGEGVIEAVSRGKYNLIDCTRRYCSYLRQNSEAGSEKKEVRMDLDSEKALHEKAKREKTELQLKVMKGELHASKDVESIMTDMITRAKVKLLGLPSKVAPSVIGFKDISKVQAILKNHIEEALLELVEYNPELFLNDKVLKDDSDG